MLAILGAVLMVASVFVYGSSMWLFVSRGRGTPLPFAPPEVFVAAGPYRHTRNPMALSVVAFLAGVSGVMGSLITSVGTAVAAVALHIYITRREEPLLVERFGESYLSYCRTVPRWLLRVSSPGRDAA
jgi:protein-S-isoprenylcysteine O-methyltransferase Ste14